MDWQLALVTLSAALALAYLGRRAWRTWAGGRAACGGCGGGCAPAPSQRRAGSPLISTDELTARLRSRR